MTTRTPATCANALGTYRFWRDLGYAIGGLIAGILADAAGLSVTVMAAAVLTAGSAILAAIWIRGKRPPPTPRANPNPRRAIHL